MLLEEIAVNRSGRGRHIKRVSNPRMDYSDAFFTIVDIFNLYEGAFRLLSELSYILHIVRKFPLDPFFLAMSIMQNIIQSYSRNYFTPYRQGYIAFSANKAYRRMLAFFNVAHGENFEIDIKSDGSGKYILDEFVKNREAIGDDFTGDVFDRQISDVPLAILIGKEIFSLSHSAIERTISLLSIRDSNMIKCFEMIETIYDDCDFKRDTDDGDIPYLPIDDGPNRSGMKIEFRYPGTKKNALSNLSFTINPGQLVAIVGVNGSGKSSITNLFNRLYDPTEGEIFVDDIPIRSYKVDDIRSSMAILRQNHFIYPLTLRENIAIGMPGKEVTEHDFDVALEKGGAKDFIEKLPKKLDEELFPVETIHGSPTTEYQEMKELSSVFENEQSRGISGGESQRLAASRTFMRLQSGLVRFLAADEPSSALDPEGEFELFSRLMEQRREMTIVLVTHRFGHITKHADLILCMKDGVLIEAGTHDELLSKGEEYYRLHNVQAQAFDKDDTSGSHVDENSASEEDSASEESFYTPEEQCAPVCSEPSRVCEGNPCTPEYSSGLDVHFNIEYSTLNTGLFGTLALASVRSHPLPNIEFYELRAYSDASFGVGLDHVIYPTEKAGRVTALRYCSTSAVTPAIDKLF
ncbi:hypothetical protein EW145_g5072 [Phellinidium pouzarii]|uniref:ABC transporter domain-containing protein n=1 Tax=Phellinidium pouzarii TaxID=167371 RepID=A0A4V3XCA3_9AGAM|nr:hypothetical protein EW145_g5072 [Phellinidium pouzarii]